MRLLQNIITVSVLYKTFFIFDFRLLVIVTFAWEIKKLMNCCLEVKGVMWTKNENWKTEITGKPCK